METDEPWTLSAVELAAGFARRDFTPLDALESCLARVQECQPALNAFVHIDADGARAAATASAERWARGEPLGPLDGVPISLKDNLHAAGMPTTWGSLLLRGFMPARDELPVARLRAAGAVLFGKTNCPEFAMQGYTSNFVAGVTRNPWNTQLTPGGSSGGAAAAVAARCGPLALATDGGGSIRRPASHCGLVGLKPSAGCVRRGNGLPEIFLQYEVVGAIGRAVRDTRLLYDALSRVTRAAPSGTSGPRRILYVPRFGSHPVDRRIAAQMREAARQFESMGIAVEEAATFDMAEEINRLWPTLSCAGLAWLLREGNPWPRPGLELQRAPDVSQCTPAAQANLRAGLAADASALFEVFAAIDVLQRRLADEVFAHHDFILTPATAALPWPADESHPPMIDGESAGPRGHAVFTAFANAAGLPAVALPTGFVDELPTGLQLVGRAGADAALLQLAQEFEDANSSWAPRSPR